MTDGVNTGDDPAATVRRLNLGGSDPVNARVFTYHFGDADDAGGKALMKSIACQNNGVYVYYEEKRYTMRQSEARSNISLLH